MAGSIQNYLGLLNHKISTTSRDRYMYNYHPHFRGEDTEAQSVKTLGQCDSGHVLCHNSFLTLKIQRYIPEGQAFISLPRGPRMASPSGWITPSLSLMLHRDRCAESQLLPMEQLRGKWTGTEPDVEEEKVL